MYFSWGCDVVLGVKWLETLGPIIWDFSKLLIEFLYGQIRVWLQGFGLQHISFEGQNKAILKSIYRGNRLLLQLFHEEMNEKMSP